MKALLRLGVGSLAEVLSMPADYAMQLLAPDAATKPAGEPKWTENPDGSRTMRVTDINQLYQMLGRKPEAKK